MDMLTIGLTGGIGCGKSTAAKCLADLGAVVWDADTIGHTIYEPGTVAFRELIEEFGDGIIGASGAIDRKKLGAIVFTHPDALARLNRIVHPRIFERMAEMIRRARAAGEIRPIVIEAAILIEAAWQSLFDQIWLVTASRETVVERISRDRKMNAQQIEARMRAQLPDDERRRHADLVISNDGTLDDLRTRLAAIFAEAVRRDNQR
jgi:dephospho-CoA kinase